MKTGLDFLLAAKRCEIEGLLRLAVTGTLVDVTARLVHGLQRERGLTNLFLASRGQRFAPQREEQIGQSRAVEAEWRAHIALRPDDPALLGHGARLYSRIAWVLQGLDSLDALRAHADALAWNTTQSTDAYGRLIAALLAVVFEAADSATDPEVSRRLVALFNFMQGKEFAGQERALGAALFARGRCDAPEQQQLLHLIDSQERCLELFGAFAPPGAQALWAAPPSSAALAELERLRRVLCTAPAGSTLKADWSPQWFDTCSARIDAMKAIEDWLSADLRATCDTQVARARADLAAVDAIARQPEADPLDFFLADARRPAGAPHSTTQGFGLRLEHSVLELVHDQAQRLQAMADELDAVRASLNERRLIERAKGLLMAHRHISEADAHKMLRQMAMNQNRRLVDVAEAVLAMADVLPRP